MIIIGCNYHPSFQQIVFVDKETGEFQEQRLGHREEAEKFYRELVARGGKLVVGMEASGQARWFERLLAELKVELRIGDAAEIRTKRVRKKKTDREDARHILQLPRELIDRIEREAGKGSFETYWLGNLELARAACSRNPGARGLVREIPDFGEEKVQSCAMSPERRHTSGIVLRARHE